MSLQIKATGQSRWKQMMMDIFIICFGLLTSSLGTALFYAAELGSSPMATFCDGIHLLAGISYGTANTLANILFLVLLVFMKRSYINVGTVLCVFTIGPFVNLFNWMLEPLPVAGWNLAVRFGFVLAGVLLMGLGLGLYVAVDRGFGPLEALVKYACVKWRVSYGKAKILQDVVLVLMGMMLGAVWGVGTLGAMLLTGPVLQWSIGFFSKRLGKAG